MWIPLKPPTWRSFSCQCRPDSKEEDLVPYERSRPSRLGENPSLLVGQFYGVLKTLAHPGLESQKDLKRAPIKGSAISSGGWDDWMALPDYHFFVNLGSSFSCFPGPLELGGKLNGHWETGGLVSYPCGSHDASSSHTGRRHGLGMDTRLGQEGKEGFKRHKFERIPKGF